jgi:transcription elongation factor Elf1
MHGDGPPWICLTCNRTFMRLASLKAHTMVHEKEENLFCEQCGEECITQVINLHDLWWN